MLTLITSINELSICQQTQHILIKQQIISEMINKTFK